MKSSEQNSSSRLLTVTIVVFLFSAFFLLTIKEFSIFSISMTFFVPAIFFVSTVFLPRIFSADRLMLSIVNFLCALGVLILYRMSPKQGLNQAINYGIGLIAMLFFIYFVRLMQRKKPVIILLIAVSAILMVLPLIFGTERNGARAWVTLFGLGFQPSELVKVLMLIIEAYFLSKRKIFSAALYAGFCMLVLMLQKDLGTALIYYGVILVMVYVATRNYLYMGLGFVGAVFGSVIGYKMFSHVKRRVAIWINPWIDYEGAGYQIVQSLIAIVNGGVWGTGLGLGNSYVIPAHTTDFIFSIIINEFGMIFGLCILFMYILLFLRGINIALRSNSRFNAILALGSSVLIALQTFIIIGGNIKMIPLTGVTLPFISYGGSSLLSSMCIMGIIQGVASINDTQVQEDKELAQLQGDLL
ncbi:MAG: FtsW/RodA/SpoVE family cell cycle protein [Clostridiales bacterium]|nr:FtsW/RodA/SpoVE family cell cycle protein [Clostridiales bacterium]